jgi:hypothetical protein
MAIASLRRIEDLREWFLQMNMPFWSLWNGFTKETKYRAAYNDDVSDINESLEVLESHLRRKTASGGKVTIFVTDKFGSPNGATEYLELMGANNTSNGIAGLPGGDPYQIAGKPMDVYIAEQVNSKLVDYKKDKKIEELEAALAEKNGGNTFFQKIGNRIAEELPVDKLPIDQLIMAAISYFTGTKQTVAISGVHPKDETQQEQDGVELSEEQAQIINTALGSIMMTFPDIPDFLTRLAKWIKENPVMAKNLLNQI